MVQTKDERRGNLAVHREKGNDEFTGGPDRENHLSSGTWWPALSPLSMGKHALTRSAREGIRWGWGC